MTAVKTRTLRHCAGGSTLHCKAAAAPSADLTPHLQLGQWHARLMEKAAFNGGKMMTGMFLFTESFMPRRPWVRTHKIHKCQSQVPMLPLENAMQVT